MLELDPAIMAVIHFIIRHSVIVVTIVFTLILVSTYWPGRARQIEEHAMIPLDDDGRAGG